MIKLFQPINNRVCKNSLEQLSLTTYWSTTTTTGHNAICTSEQHGFHDQPWTVSVVVTSLLLSSTDKSSKWRRQTCHTSGLLVHIATAVLLPEGVVVGTNWSGLVFQSWFLLFGPIHVIADNLARFMSADKKISNPDSNSVFRSNTIKNTWFGFFESTRRISGKFHVFWGITRLSDTSALEYSIFGKKKHPT